MNGDGSADLVTHFRVAETGIAPGDEDACLTGRTVSGVRFGDCDAIRTVPPGCGFGFDHAALALLVPLGWRRGRHARARRQRRPAPENARNGDSVEGAAAPSLWG